MNMKQTYATPFGQILTVAAADCIRMSLNYEDENDGLSLPRVEWKLTSAGKKGGR